MPFNFFLLFFLFYIFIMIAMCFDNLFWIPADYKWYGTGEWKPYFYVFLTVPWGNKREFIVPKSSAGWSIVKERVCTVLTSMYDIVPALILSLISLIITILIYWGL